ncbi:MAG: FAD-dependent oxidoreductase, partial [Nocardioides sp.]|nr:FAD-dependent oxidoreductase [Nocardioides sp.]
ATGAHRLGREWALDKTQEPDGATYDGVGPVKDLDDGAAWLDRFTDAAGGRLVVAGGSYIGIEMAEAALRRGFKVTLVTRSRVMSSFDPDMSDRIVEGLRRGGVEVVENAAVTGLGTSEGRVRSVGTDSGSFACDLLVLALGIRPATGFLDGNVLERGPSGGLRPDPRGVVAPGVWAAGDCCEVRHRMLDDWAYLPLGTHANKLGRAVGENLGGGHLEFDGALGTAITRFVEDGVHLEIACTGLNTALAEETGLEVVSLVTEGTTASGYMPEAEPIAIKVLAEKGTRRLLGVQVVGGRGAGKRIDAVAACLWGEMTVDDLAWMDLSYAPPFATAWEVVSLAARRLAERL